MHQSTFSQRSSVSLAVLVAVCVVASGASAQDASYLELLLNTQYTLGSTIANQLPSVNWTPECTNAGAGGFARELGLAGCADIRNDVSGQIQGNWKFQLPKFCRRA